MSFHLFVYSVVFLFSSLLMAQPKALRPLDGENNLQLVFKTCTAEIDQRGYEFYVEVNSNYDAVYLHVFDHIYTDKMLKDERFNTSIRGYTIYDSQDLIAGIVIRKKWSVDAIKAKMPYLNPASHGRLEIEFLTNTTNLTYKSKIYDLKKKSNRWLLFKVGSDKPISLLALKFRDSWWLGIEDLLEVESCSGD